MRVSRAGPWRELEDVEYATLESVAGFNTGRLLDRSAILSSAEYKAQFAELQTAPGAVGALN